MTRTIKIAAVQARPVYMDLEATIAKACRLIAEVGAAGGDLAVFPEAFVSGYPLWVWFIPAGHTHPLREIYAEFVANAVTVPSDATSQLCTAAKAAGVAVAIGINEVNAEGSGTTIYNTLLYIAPDGEIMGKQPGMRRYSCEAPTGANLALVPINPIGMPSALRHVTSVTKRKPVPSHV